MKQRSAWLDFLFGFCCGVPPLILLLFSNGLGACSSAFPHSFSIACGIYLAEIFFLFFLLSQKKSVSNASLLGACGMFFFDLLLGGVDYFTMHMLCLVH